MPCVPCSALQCFAMPLGIELFLGVRGAEAVPVCTDAARGATDLGMLGTLGTPWVATKHHLGSQRHRLAFRKIPEDGEY